MDVDRIRKDYIRKIEQSYSSDCQMQFGSIQHHKKVRAIAVTPDNKYLITGSRDDSMIFWDLETKKSVRRIHDVKLENTPGEGDKKENDEDEEEDDDDEKFDLKSMSPFVKTTEFKVTKELEIENHDDFEPEVRILPGINNIAISPNGKYLITINQTQHTVIWEIETKQPKIIFDRSVCKNLRKVAISPNSKFFVTGGRDGLLKLWNFENYDSIAKFPTKHNRGITALEISKDGKYMISCSNEKMIYVWDFHKRTVFKMFPNPHKDKIWETSISPNSKYFVTSSKDQIQLWDIEGHEQNESAFEAPHKGKVSAVCFTNDEKYLISSGSQDNCIKLWGLEYKNGKLHPYLEHTFDAVYKKGVYGFAVTTDSKYILATSGKGQLKMLSIHKKEVIDTFDGAHEKPIIATAFGSDDDLILSASLDKSLKLWSIKENKMVKEIKYAVDPIDNLVCVAFSKDCQTAASGSEKGTVKIWDLQTGVAIQSFKSNDEKILSIIFTNDSKSVIIGSGDKSIKILDIKEGKVTKSFKDAHREGVSCLQLINNTELISGSYDRTIKMWNLSEDKHVYTFENTHSDRIYSISANQKYIVSASGDKSIKIWDLSNKGMYHHFFNAHNDEILSVCLSSDSEYIVSTSKDKTMKLWSLVTKRELHDFHRAHEHRIGFAAISSDNSYFVSSSYDKTIKIWDLESSALFLQFDKVQRVIKRMALSADGLHLVTADYGNSIKFWDISKGGIHFVYEDPDKISITTLGITSNGHSVIYGTSKGLVKHLNTKTYNATRHEIPGEKPQINIIKITHDDDHYVVGFQDGTLVLMNLKSGQTHHVFKDHHKAGIKDICITSNDQFMVTCSQDQTMKLWNLDNMQMIYHFDDAHDAAVLSVVISHDMKFIVSVANDDTMKIWDFMSRNLRSTVKHIHQKRTDALAIHPNSKYVYTGSGDATIKMWNIENGDLIYHYQEAHKGKISSIVVAPKGDYFFSSSEESQETETNSRTDITTVRESSIKMWNIPPTIISSKGLSIYLNVLPKFSSDDDILVLPYYFTRMHDFFLRVFNFEHDSKAEIDDTYRIIQALVAKKTSFDDIKNEKFFKNLEKMDYFGNIPFDYLIGHEHIKNILRINFLKYQRKTNLSNFMKIMFENKHKFLAILKAETMSNTKTVINFLTLCLDEFDDNDVAKGRVAIGYNRPDYGATTGIAIRTKSPLLSSHHQSMLMKEVDDLQSQRLKFFRTTWPLDLRLHSQETFELLDFLKKQNKRFYFENKFILLVLKYFWRKAKAFQFSLFFAHSAFMVCYTIECANSEAVLEKLDKALLGLSCIMLFNKLVQLWVLSVKEFFDFWGLQDFVCYIVVGVTMIMNLGGSKHEIIPYLKTIGLFSGYFRWIGYFRVFDGMRSLIRTIVEILKDMKNLVIIIVFTVSAYSAVLESFNYGGSSNYLNNVYNAYFFIYDSRLADEPEIGLKIIAMVFPFVINVIFLNMLISIMGDTYDKLQEKSLYADNQERLKLIRDVVSFARFFKTIRSNEKINNLASQIVSTKLLKPHIRTKCCKRKADNSYTQVIPQEPTSMTTVVKIRTNLRRNTQQRKTFAQKSKSLQQMSSLSNDSFYIDRYFKEPSGKYYYLMNCEYESTEVETEWEGKLNFLSKQIDQTRSTVTQAMKTFDQTRKELKSEIASIKDTALLQISFINSNLKYLAKSSGKPAECTVLEHGISQVEQECYLCLDCNAYTCINCAQECHQFHVMRKEQAREFSCQCAFLFPDCKKKQTCTYKYTGKRLFEQALWFCKKCMKVDSQGVCNYCRETCHKGHDVVLKQARVGAYCSCADVCADSCKYRSEYIAQVKKEEEIALKLKLSHEEGLEKIGEEDSDSDVDTPVNTPRGLKKNDDENHEVGFSKFKELADMKVEEIKKSEPVIKKNEVEIKKK